MMLAWALMEVKGWPLENGKLQGFSVSRYQILQ